MIAFPTSLNPNDTTGGALSNGNLTFTTPINTVPGGLSRAHDGYDSNKYYFEVTISGESANNYTGIGLCPSNATFSQITTSGTNAALFAALSGAVSEIFINGTSEVIYAFSLNTIRVAVDLTNQLVWFAPGLTANWNDNASANPATGTGGLSMPFTAVELYPFAVTSDEATFVQIITFNFGATAFAGTTPSGFTAGWPTVVPAIPAGLYIDDPSPTTLTANWDTVSGPGTITYTLQYRQTGTTPWTQITGISALSYTITGLAYNTEYDVQIEAVNANANSGFSSTVNGFTLPKGQFLLPKQQNLKVSYQYINWTLETNRAIMAHLYKFTSATGENDYFTDFDIDIFWNNVNWKSSALRFEGLQRKLSIGLDVDEQSLKIWAAPTDTLFGANFLTGAEEGLLDGAIIVRYRIIWPFVSGNVALDIGNTPIAIWPLSTGFTSSISKGGASHIELKVKSALHKLDVNMPRNYYQPGCLWTLFDQGCTLSKAAFAVTGTIGTGPTANTIPITGGISPPTGADGLPIYSQGRLLFTSGVNSGLQVLIDSNDSANLYLAYLLDDLPSAGDDITFYPGCSKSFNTCQLKFSNQANFRGFDKVPPVMVSI